MALTQTTPRSSNLTITGPSHVVTRRARAFTRTNGMGETIALDVAALRQTIKEACDGLNADPSALLEATLGTLYPGIPEDEILRAANLAARAQVEIEPDYAFAAARLLLVALYREALGRPVSLSDAGAAYRAYLPVYLETGIAAGLLDPALATFDLTKMAAALRPERDLRFAIMGVQTLYDRYLLQDQGRRFELPQLFWLRVAMGLSLGERDREAHAIAFYDLISQFLFTPATPTLFNAGTRHPQLSSCFLTTVPDDLGDIYKGTRINKASDLWYAGQRRLWAVRGCCGEESNGTDRVHQGLVQRYCQAVEGQCPSRVHGAYGARTRARGCQRGGR